MIRVSVGSSYEDFKRVVGGLGKSPVVFWSRENPTRVNMWALVEHQYIVHTTFEVPPPLGPLSPLSPLDPALNPSPFAPAPANHPQPSGPFGAQTPPHTFPATPTKGPVATLGELQGGSGYVPGTYSSQTTKGGSGSGLTVDVVVNSSGVIDSAVIRNQGIDYTVRDIIEIALPGGSGFRTTVESIVGAAVVPVAPGVTVPPMVPVAPATPGAPAAPKTVLETDFPGAIELPGGAVTFS